jgi:hypothetical protein
MTDPHVIGHFGKDGDNAFVVTLDRYGYVATCNSDDELIANLSFDIQVIAKYGSSDVLSDCTITASINDSDWDTPTVNAGVVTVGASAGTSLLRQTDVTIVVTHTTYGSMTLKCSISRSSKGQRGQSITGQTGPMYYPAGVYNASQTYTVTDKLVPVVVYGGTYYYAKKTVPADRGYYPTNTEYWGAFSNFAAAFIQIIFTQFASLGAFIINEDFFISQYGTLVSSNGQAIAVTSSRTQGSVYMKTVEMFGSTRQVPYYAATSDEYADQACYTYFKNDDPKVEGLGSSSYPKFRPVYFLNALTGETYNRKSYTNGDLSAFEDGMGGWEIKPSLYGILGFPTISGKDKNGNEVLKLFFDGNPDDLSTAIGGGGMMFNTINSGAAIPPNARFTREQWRVNSPSFEVSGSSSVSSIWGQAFDSYAALQMYLFGNNSDNVFNAYLESDGARLYATKWKGKNDVGAGSTYVDDWGNLKVKRSSGYEQFNFVFGQNNGTNIVTLPASSLLYPVPDGTMYFVKGNGNTTVRSLTPIMNSQNANAWSMSGNYYQNNIMGTSDIFVMQTVPINNGSTSVKAWIEFYASA